MRQINLILFSILISFPAPSAGHANVKKAPQQFVQEAHPFVLKDEMGKLHRLEDFKGKAVLLHFWASWCAPCLEELPAIVEGSKQYPEEKFRLVLVSLDENWEAAKGALPKGGLPKEGVVSLLDPESQLSDRYGSFQFPETYFISKDQRIITKWVGPQKWSSDFMKTFIAKFL